LWWVHAFSALWNTAQRILAKGKLSPRVLALFVDTDLKAAISSMQLADVPVLVPDSTHRRWLGDGPGLY
jgi:hypothetical protein